jgi:hypothetical protein
MINMFSQIKQSADLAITYLQSVLSQKGALIHKFEETLILSKKEVYLINKLDLDK